MANRQHSLPDDLKKELENIKKETNISVNALVNMACFSLVANYKKAGTFIFVDLLDPEKRN